jgi:hypothetical protein
MNTKKTRHVLVGFVFLCFLAIGPGAECFGTCDCDTSGTNTFLGWQAGFCNGTGIQNTALGYRAGYANVFGSRNTFVGFWAGRLNLRYDNTFVGFKAGGNNTLGIRNTFLGRSAGERAANGSYNTYLGYSAGLYNLGSRNTYVGYCAGRSLIPGVGNTGARNTFLGYLAGYKNTSGSGNVLLGYGAGFNLTTASNRLYIANGSLNSNVLICGSFSPRTVSIATTALVPFYRLYVNGHIKATGNVYAACGILICSDARLKKEVKPIENALDQIANLRGVAFRWKDKETDDNKPQLGVIGQEVEKVFPGAVSTDSEGYKSVAYGNLIAPLIEAVKELKAENDTLKERILALEKKVTKDK